MRSGRAPFSLLVLLILASPGLAAGDLGTGASSPTTMAALYLGGLLFLLFEIFLVPGFGLPGMLGLGLLSANLFLVFQSYGSSVAWSILTVQFVLGGAATFAAMKILPQTAMGKAMTHSTSLETKAPSAPLLDPDLWVGKSGKTRGALCPQGYVVFEGEEFDAKVKGGMIKSGQAVTVVGVEHQTLIVETTGSEGNN